MIRESGDPTAGVFHNTLRAKGRINMHRCPIYPFLGFVRRSTVCAWFSLTLLLLGLTPYPALSEEGISLAEDPPAQDTQEEEIATMEPVVVSATKTPVPISHLTSAVEVITAETIKKRKIKSVPEALRLSQGLMILESGGPGTTATARIRGGNADQTLVLIDGAIMNSGTLGSYNFSNLMVNDIEKIEILRGAQGMLWGADAIGGVINITTKRGEGTPRARTFFEFGSFTSLREGASVSGKQGPIDLSGSLWRWDIAKFSAVNFRRGALERDAYRNWQANMHLGVTLPLDGRIDFTYRWLNGDTLLDNGTTFGNGPFDVFSSKATNNQYIYTGSYYQPLTSWWSQKLTLSRAQESNVTLAGTDQRSVVTGETTPVLFNTDSQIDTLNNRIEWQHNFQVVKPLALNVGYQFREQQGENISPTGFPTKIISSNAGFAQAQLSLWDRLFATGGFRQDSYNTFGDATTWRVTGGYLVKETGTKLRSSYGTGFRAPTINQLFFPNFGNPDLQPEKSQSWDIAVEQKLFHQQLFLSAGYFWNRFNNLILAVFDPGACSDISEFAFCAQNIGSANSKGVEANFKLTLPSTHRFLKLLELQGQYTYTLTKDLDTGARLPRWPVHSASALLTYQPIHPIVTTIAFRYVGTRFNSTGDREPMPQFTVWDFSLTWQVNPNFQAYTRVDNIFDRKYEEVLNFGVPVRSIYFGIRANFDVPLTSPEKESPSS
jgi:vitamin B12 transporter